MNTEIKKSHLVPMPFSTTRKMTLSDLGDDIASRATDIISEFVEITAPHNNPKLSGVECTAAYILALRSASEMLTREAENITKKTGVSVI